MTRKSLLVIWIVLTIVIWVTIYWCELGSWIDLKPSICGGIDIGGAFIRYGFLWLIITAVYFGIKARLKK